MCDVTAPIHFVHIKYKTCPTCGEYSKHFLLLPKVGPLLDLEKHRGLYYIQVSDISMIDDWEIEIQLKEQSVSPVELGEFDNFVPYELTLCAAQEIEFGVLTEEQLSRSRELFQSINVSLNLLHI